MEEEKTKLKVGDLIPFSQATYDNAVTSIEALSKLHRDYTTLKGSDPHTLERIKREFLGHMYHFTTVFAKIKCYKSDSHTYLADLRKRHKAETIDILLKEGVKITAAESLCYSHPYFVERVELTESIKAFFIKADLLNELFQSTFQSMVQSLSGAKKELENSKKDTSI